MTKLKKIQKEVKYLKVLIEDYRGGRNDERYINFLKMLNGYKKDLQGWTMVLQRSLRDSVLRDIEYSLRTLENRVDKASNADILINKVKYDFQQLAPQIEGFSGRRNDLEHVQFKARLTEFSRMLTGLGTAQKNTLQVQALLKEIEEYTQKLEEKIQTKNPVTGHPLFPAKSVDQLTFNDRTETFEKKKTRPVSTYEFLIQNVDAPEDGDCIVKKELDDIDIVISKIKLTYAVTNPDDTEKLEQLEKQILDTYTNLELLPKNIDHNLEERKQIIGRILISLNKKISLDKKEAVKGKQTWFNILETVDKEIKALERDLESCKGASLHPEHIEQIDEEIKRIYLCLEAVPNVPQTLEKLKSEKLVLLEKLSNQLTLFSIKTPTVDVKVALKSNEDVEQNDIDFDNYLQKTKAFKEEWGYIRDNVFNKKRANGPVMEIVEILRDVKNDIYNHTKAYQPGNRPSRNSNNRLNSQSYELLQASDEVFYVEEKKNPNLDKYFPAFSTEISRAMELPKPQLPILINTTPSTDYSISGEKPMKKNQSVEELKKNYEVRNCKRSIDFAKSQLDSAAQEQKSNSRVTSSENDISTAKKSSLPFLPPPRLPSSLPPPLQSLVPHIEKYYPENILEIEQGYPTPKHNHSKTKRELKEEPTEGHKSSEFLLNNNYKKYISTIQNGKELAKNRERNEEKKYNMFKISFNNDNLPEVSTAVPPKIIGGTSKTGVSLYNYFNRLSCSDESVEQEKDHGVHVYTKWASKEAASTSAIEISKETILPCLSNHPLSAKLPKNVSDLQDGEILSLTTNVKNLVTTFEHKNAVDNASYGISDFLNAQQNASSERNKIKDGRIDALELTSKQVVPTTDLDDFDEENELEKWCSSQRCSIDDTNNSFLDDDDYYVESESSDGTSI